MQRRGTMHTMSTRCSVLRSAPQQRCACVPAPQCAAHCSHRASVRSHAFSTQQSNPAMQFGRIDEAVRESRSTTANRWPGEMTMNGALGKTAILLAITAVSAAFSWQQGLTQLITAQQAGALMAQSANGIMQTSQGAGITAFVLAMVTAFKPNWARWSAPLYAAVKGFFLGAISLFFELQYPGIAMSAVLLTLSTTGGLLALYKGNFIRVTDRFRNIITTGLTGLLVAYLGRFLLSLMGVNFAFLSGGAVGLALGALVTALSAATLLLDFDSMQQCEMRGMPQQMEWYCGFSVLVSFVWLYVNFLRLLSMLQRSD